MEGGSGTSKAAKTFKHVCSVIQLMCRDLDAWIQNSVARNSPRPGSFSVFILNDLAIETLWSSLALRLIIEIITLTAPLVLYYVLVLIYTAEGLL